MRILKSFESFENFESFESFERFERFEKFIEFGEFGEFVEFGESFKKFWRVFESLERRFVYGVEDFVVGVFCGMVFFSKCNGISSVGVIVNGVWCFIVGILI